MQEGYGKILKDLVCSDNTRFTLLEAVIFTCISNSVKFLAKSLSIALNLFH